MKTCFLGLTILLVVSIQLNAQLQCASSAYRQQQLDDPRYAEQVMDAERGLSQLMMQSREQQGIIKIPVVFHILYHYPEQKISDQQVIDQLAALNRDFRRRNPDSSKTPSFFKSFAADCELEFYLAKSDPRSRSTNGIIKKYTPVEYWGMDDKMKSASDMGNDGWDPKSYLNIWVCEMKNLAGYSSLLGGPENRDGIVIDFGAFGTGGNYNMGRTLVHEVGHWLGLKHIWGDADCGDDGINDTPTQSFYTAGCPSGIRVTCGNAPYGNMYMNYMDFTSDACMNLFTLGQKQRMRSLFSSGGPRNSFLVSKGLDQPLIQEINIPEPDPKWLNPKLFPNPVQAVLTIDLSNDVRWIGKIIYIRNISGQMVKQVRVENKIQEVDLGGLQGGVYFLNAVKEDGARIDEKIIKL